MITRERWQKIKDIFNSALNQPAAERIEFVAGACEGDEALRQEVESLISAHEEEDNFLDAPAHELAAEILTVHSPGLLDGQQLGPYTILSSLGAGGMGEVYLAQDVRLNRKIALKLLASEFARDEQRVRRFEQEAHAASALNHPNVCVVHEVGKTADGRHFMAMEFIDGMTLRRRMAQKRLTLKEVLDVAAQVTWALEAAHAAGIIHRDIKPENIMLRRDGYVKVLDFGIAKLNSHSPRVRDDTETEALVHLDTDPGTLLGTAKYMSPEQLREQPVDQRSDIWSLGVVLHEMITGFTPFEAQTTNETIAVILDKQPPRLGFPAGEVPEEFQQLVRKALSKKRRERYQTISQLGSDLRKIRRQISAEDATEKLEQPTLDFEKTVGNQQQKVETAGVVSTMLLKVKSQAIWTADYVLSEIKQHKTAAVFSGVTVAFALLFIGLNPPNLFRRAPSSVSPPTVTVQMTPFTNHGKSVCATISPDGKSVAHAKSRNGMQELLVTSIATAATSVLLEAADVQYRGVTFSRDSNYLYFTRTEKGDTGILYQLALPGNHPRRIKDHVDSPISFSPGGDRFSFVRVSRADGEYSLMVANVDGSNEQTLVTRRDGNRLSLGGPAWSPDGKTIVCGAGWWDKGYRMNLIQVSLEDQRERVIGGKHWFSIQQVAWLEDSTGLIISVKEQPLNPNQLWRISYPQGELVRITNDRVYNEGVGISSDGKSIVTVQSHRDAKIWVAPDGDVRRAKAIASTVGFTYGLGWTGKGKIAFSSMAQDRLNISLTDLDGANQTQLTVNAGDNYTPATSPDGRYIVFASNRTGSFNIWRMSADDGSDPKQLTFSDGNSYPSVLPDGQWIVYDNQDNARPTIWKVPIEGGEPLKLTDSYARMPVVSPENQFIACRYYVEADLRGIAIIPMHGGAPIKLLPIPVMDYQRVQWLANGRALSFVMTVMGTSNIWSYDLDSGSTRQLTDFKDERIFAYSWSPDYKQLACERGSEIRDVIMIKIQE